MELGVMGASELSFIETPRYAVCKVLLLFQTHQESIEALFVIELYERLQVLSLTIRHLALTE
jgi:hypothetical protein